LGNFPFGGKHIFKLLILTVKHTCYCYYFAFWYFLFILQSGKGQKLIETNAVHDTKHHLQEHSFNMYQLLTGCHIFWV